MGEHTAEADASLDLPPGFRFHPTDEEIITHYLTEKVLNANFTAKAIADVDLNKCEPWDLPRKAKMGEKEWYFFCQRDRKYPTGMRTNRATEAGYWKATGKDKEIFKGKGCLVGMKKTLVFYRGRAPKGEKTNWVMHEFRPEGKLSYQNHPKAVKDEWVVCRVFHKSSGFKKCPGSGILRMNSFGNEFLDSPPLPPLRDALGPSEQGVGFFGDEFKSFTDSQSQLKLPEANRLPYYPSAAMIHEECPTCLPRGLTGSITGSYFHPQVSPPIPPPNLLNTHHPMNNIPILTYPNPEISCLDERTADDIMRWRKQSKVEQFSTQSMLSHDTGLTTDLNTEISSSGPNNAISGNKIYNELQSASSGLVDLECLWNY